MTLTPREYAEKRDEFVKAIIGGMVAFNGQIDFITRNIDDARETATMILRQLGYTVTEEPKT